MTVCTATLQVGGETVECEVGRHDAMSKHTAFGAKITWQDDVLGATPHQEPTPTYKAVPRPAGAWAVMVGMETAAYYSMYGRHPDPQGAAEVEAARLNGEGDAERNVLRHEVEFQTDRAERAEAEGMRLREGLSRVCDSLADARRVSPVGPLVKLIYAIEESTRRALDGGEA